MPRYMLPALMLSAALVGGSLLAAAPADAATPCHDSASVQHAKAKERGLLADQRAGLRDVLVSLKDQQVVDRDKWNNDRANSGTTREVLQLDTAHIQRDSVDIAAVQTAMSRFSQDRAYLAQCGTRVLIKGVTRVITHSAQLTLSLDRSSLAAETAELASDERGLADALSSGDTTLQHEYRANIDSDKALIRALQNQITKLEQQIAEL